MISVDSTFVTFVAGGVLLPLLQPIEIKINRKLNTNNHDIFFTFTPLYEFFYMYV